MEDGEPGLLDRPAGSEPIPSHTGEPDGVSMKGTTGRGAGAGRHRASPGRSVDAVWYSVLGPLTVSVDGRSVNVGGPKQRLVLALLLTDVGVAVTPDRLIDGVWGDDPPHRARHTLQAYVSELRRVLADAIEWSGHGYRLTAAPDRVDSVRFEELVASGAQALVDAPEAAATQLADALGLWRGDPFADLGEAPGLQSEVQRLRQLRLVALEQRIEADLALGAHQNLVEELETLTGEFPFRERFRAQHMIALYRSGRQTEALRGFARTRSFLVEELGVEPGPELQRVHDMVLRQDPALDPAVTAPEPSRQPERTIRGLELREVIGRGHSSVVHHAFQPSLGREVAVKVIAPEIAGHPEFIRRFEAHAQTVAALEHPHILTLYDFWRAPDGAHVVLPYARGGNVAEALEKGRWSLATILRAAEQTGAALSHAHRRGVLHGGVSAGNVLLDEDGHAYLADFGLLSARGRSHLEPSTTGAVQRGVPPTVAEDIAAFGVLVHRMLGGAEAPGGFLTPVSDIRDDVPAELDGVLRRAAETGPAERYERIDDLLRELRRVLGADVVGAAPGPAEERVPFRNPYKGLRAFQETDADDFFGRDDLTERLLETLLGHRLTAVVGPSGSGKSSLVRAGMIPAVRSGGLPGSDTWLISDMFPGAHPFEELAAALSRVAVERIDGMFDDLVADERGLLRVTKHVLPGDDTLLLLIIDQFEELFSMVADPTVRELFLDSLSTVASDPRGRVRVVITLRADFFDRPLAHHDFGSLVEAGLVPVTVPSEEGLALAISRPARLAGLELEQGLVAEIVRDVKGQPGGLPLMQHALAELARRRRDGLLTFEAYVAAGGVSGALGNRAEELFASLEDSEQRTVEQVFLRLVSVNETTEDARRRVRRSELTALDIEPGTLDRALQQFGAHRLLSFDRDPVTRGATVEVAHEALLHGWARLRQWVDDRRSDLLLQRRLAAAAHEWEGAGRDGAFLLGGGRLEQLESWSAQGALPLTVEEREFLSASRDREDRQRRRLRRRRRGLTAVLSGLTVAALVLAAIATDRSREVEVRSLLAAAASNVRSDPELALVLAIEAAERAEGRVRGAVTGVLHEALLRGRVVRSIPGTGTLAWSRSTNRIAALTDGTNGRTVSVRDAATGDEITSVTPGHGGVTGLAWSGDGELLAITSDGGPTLIWETTTGTTRAEVPAEAGGHYFPSFGANDDLLSVSDLPRRDTAGRTDSVVIWDVGASTQLRRMTLDTQVFGTHLSPVDPLLLVSEPETARASIWDVRTGRKTIDLGAQGFHNDFVRFSPDGAMAAVLGRQQVKVWDSRSGELLADLPVGVGALDVEWSPDGELLATAGNDAEVRVFDVGAGTQVRSLAGAEETVAHVEFGPTGRELAALGDHIRIWDLRSPVGVEVAAHPTARPISDAAWTPDRDHVVTIGSDGAAEVVDLIDAATGDLMASIRRSTPRLPPAGFRPPPAKIAVSPDGRTIAATLHGTRTLIIDAASFDVVTVLDPGGTPGSFSPDSRRLVVGDSRAAYVYDTRTWNRTGTIERQRSTRGFTWFYDAAHHPERDILFLADSDATGRAVTVWDVSGEPERVAELPLGRAATMVSVSTDGRRLAAGDVMSGVVRVWDVEPVLAGEDPASAVVLDVDAGGFMPGAVLNEDGTRLLTSLGRGDLTLWDTDTGHLLYTVEALDGTVNEPRISADGSRILIPTADVVHELTLDSDELLDIARGRVTRPLTDQECRLYLGGGCPGDR